MSLCADRKCRMTLVYRVTVYTCIILHKLTSSQIIGKSTEWVQLVLLDLDKVIVYFPLPSHHSTRSLFYRKEQASDSHNHIELQTSKRSPTTKEIIYFSDMTKTNGKHMQHFNESSKFHKCHTKEIDTKILLTDFIPLNPK